MAQTIPHRPTLKEVASAAGVSVSTASRVLSGDGRTSTRTRRAVLAASRELGYRPHSIARALRRRMTGTVGMVVPQIRNPFFADLVEAVERQLQGRELELVLTGADDNPATELRRVQTLLERRVDGLIIIPVDSVRSVDAVDLAEEHTPVVQLDRRVSLSKSDHVGVDNAVGITQVLAHLHDGGCRRIQFASGAPTSSTGQSRLDAFTNGVRQYPEIDADEPMLGEFAIDFGFEVAAALADASRRPDAVVCGSDLIGVGVVRGLHDRGVSVPGDVRVTGFDDIALSALIEPTLTTVRQPVDEIAREGVRMLTERLSGSAISPRRSEIAPRLVMRRSSDFS